MTAPRSGRQVEQAHYGALMQEKKLNQNRTTREEFALITGKSNPALAQKVADILDTELIKSVGVPKFPNGELDIQIAKSVRKLPAVIMQAATPGHVNDNVLEVCLLLDALRAASSGERTVFFSPFPYERKDRQDNQQSKKATRQSIAARLMMQLMQTAGADRFQALDLHLIQETGFTTLPFDPMYASKIFVPYLKDKLPEGKKIVLSPDGGGVNRVQKYNEFLQLNGFAFGYKTRGPDGADLHGIMGDVKGAHVLLIDDVISTGGSIVKAAKLAHTQGALSVTVVATHGQFINERGKVPSLQQLDQAGIERIYVTDTLKHRKEVVNHHLIEIVSVAPLVADMVRTAALGHNSIHDFSE